LDAVRLEEYQAIESINDRLARKSTDA